MEEINCQYDLTLQCVRSTFDGLTCINRSVNLVLMQEVKENQINDGEYEGKIETDIDENVALLLLSRLNDTCLKLAKNVDLLIRTPLALAPPSKHAHSVQRQQSNASSISKQSVDDLNSSGLMTTNTVYDDMIDKLNSELDSLRNRLAEQYHRTQILEEQLDQCKSAHLTAKILFDTQEKKLHEQLTVKDKQIISIASNEHDVLRQLLDEKTNAFERLNEEHESLMAKYHSEYNRNLDCMIKTDALHDHIRLLSDTLAVKEVNEEKLTTQQQQMKKLVTLLLPAPPLSIKKTNEKRTFGRKVKRHLRESFSSLINQKQTSSTQPS